MKVSAMAAVTRMLTSFLSVGAMMSHSITSSLFDTVRQHDTDELTNHSRGMPRRDDMEPSCKSCIVLRNSSCTGYPFP